MGLLMNKLLTGILTLSLYAGAVQAKSIDGQILSIDSVRLMQQSKEGQALFAEFEAERNKAVEGLKKSEEEVKSLAETMNKQQALLSPDALREKKTEIERKEKQLARKRDGVAEDLNSLFQGRQEALFSKQMGKASQMFDERKGSVLLDKRTPGVLAVNESLDMTDDVIKVVNAEYDATLKNASNKSA